MSLTWRAEQFHDEESALVAASISMRGGNFFSYEEVMNETAPPTLPLNHEDTIHEDDVLCESSRFELGTPTDDEFSYDDDAWIKLTNPEGLPFCRDCEGGGRPLPPGAECDTCKTFHCPFCGGVYFIDTHTVFEKRPGHRA